MNYRVKSRANGLLMASLLPLSLLSFTGVAQSSQVQPLIIDDIVCEGNITTECDFITKKYYQNIGDILNPNEIADAKLRLGTLFQFKTVNARLAKGTQRGHVVVIFEVQEAQNVQYQLGSGYSVSKVDTSEPFCFVDSYSSYRSCSGSNGKVQGPAFNASVTDFNFWGSGKQLSFGVSGSKRQDDLTSYGSIERNDESIEYYSRDSDGSGTHYTMSLEYYDPHLFNTSLYYFRARVNHQRSSYRYNARWINDIEQSNGARETSRTSATPVHLEVGRRFASHSYVSVDLDGYYTSSDNTQSVGINYGWDSQDDSLFPTQGSVFAASFHFKPQHLDEGTFSLSYKKNFELFDNNILSIGNATLYTSVNGLFGLDHQLSSEIFARFTDITSIDKAAGTYAGWFVEGVLGASTSSDYAPSQYQYGIRSGYTYQSDSMIYRLSLGFHHQEHN